MLAWEAQGSERHEDYFKNIINLVLCGHCLGCAGDAPAARALECESRGPLPPAASSDSQRSNVARKDRRVFCTSCRSPKCMGPERPPCPQCRDVECADLGRCAKDPAPVRAAKVLRNKEGPAAFQCFARRIIRCQICGDQPRCAFKNHGRAKKRGARPRCEDCSRPQCTSASCRTCPNCRSPECRRKKKCKEPIQPSSSPQFPRTSGEKQTNRCVACRFPPRTVCRRAMCKGSQSLFARR